VIPVALLPVELACSWFCAPTRDSASEELQMTLTEIYRKKPSAPSVCCGRTTDEERIASSRPAMGDDIRVRWPHDAADFKTVNPS
jgi:hypothetical protein